MPALGLKNLEQGLWIGRERETPIRLGERGHTVKRRYLVWFLKLVSHRTVPMPDAVPKTAKPMGIRQNATPLSN